MFEPLAHIHYTRSMFAHTTQRVQIAGLILALLLAQGLRVCIHAYGAPHIADHAHEVFATHLESTFSVLGIHQEEMSDAHITLIGMLKHLSAQPLIAVVLLTLILVLLQTGILRLAQPRDQVSGEPHMKNLTLIAHADVQQALADALRSIKQVSGFTFTPVEGHGAQDGRGPTRSARDRVVSYTPQVRVDILLEDGDVGVVLQMLRVTDCGLAGRGIYWVTPVEQRGRL